MSPGVRTAPSRQHKPTKYQSAATPTHLAIHGDAVGCAVCRKGAACPFFTWVVHGQARHRCCIHGLFAAVLATVLEQVCKLPHTQSRRATAGTAKHGR